VHLPISNDLAGAGVQSRKPLGSCPDHAASFHSQHGRPRATCCQLVHCFLKHAALGRDT
jgi:hypothetical protein